MSNDSITDEIRSIRRDLSSKFENDLDLILADVRAREAMDDRTYVSLSPRPATPSQDLKTDASITIAISNRAEATSETSRKR